MILISFPTVKHGNVKEIDILFWSRFQWHQPAFSTFV